MQLPPDALLFTVAGLDDPPFQPPAAGEVAGRGVYPLALRPEYCAPLKPSVGAVLAPKTILEGQSLWAPLGKPAAFRLRGGGFGLASCLRRMGNSSRIS
jgi:hypothetical protein